MPTITFVGIIQYLAVEFYDVNGKILPFFQDFSLSVYICVYSLVRSVNGKDVDDRCVVAICSQISSQL